MKDYYYLVKSETGLEEVIRILTDVRKSMELAGLPPGIWNKLQPKAFPAILDVLNDVSAAKMAEYRRIENLIQEDAQEEST